MLGDTLLWIAFGAMVCAYLIYSLEQRRGLIEPSRASWMIWSAANAVEAFTYSALNQGAGQNLIFFTSSLACLFVTLSIWRHGRWKLPSLTDSLCMLACVASLAVWVVWNDAFWAHVVILIMVPISFIPTWVSVRADRRHEMTAAWGLWSIADFCVLLHVIGSRPTDAMEVTYVALEFLCHASMWVMVGLFSINPFRTLRLVKGKLLLLTDPNELGQRFLIGRSRLGKTVHSADLHVPGTVLMRFRGPVISADAVPNQLADASDRFVQIGPKTWLGPSGGVDDLVNHGCAPNAGLRFGPEGPELVAIEALLKGEEIRWDYSTTLVASNWTMHCKCGAPVCRQIVGDFRTVPRRVRMEYLRAGVLPDYAVADLRRELETGLSEAERDLRELVAVHPEPQLWVVNEAGESRPAESARSRLGHGQVFGQNDPVGGHDSGAVT
jgi:hypothetical protein